MKIIISPAKKMNVDTDTFACMGLPVFLSRTKELMDYMKELSYEEAKKLWSCNVFGEEVDGKIVQKGTLAKMARGEMVRFLAENEVDTLEGVKEFRGLSYEFSEGLSSEKEYIFIKKA